MSKKDIYKRIGKNISNIRRQKGYTQEDFAEIMDKSWSYVAKLETGMQNFSIGKLIDIAEFLEIDLNSLLKLND
ncbi:MAG: helix-turn-helix transcriptional regulator [Candidatus Gastranaerophilales bacterium]